jgi:hypothetical protein
LINSADEGKQGSLKRELTTLNGSGPVTGRLRTLLTQLGGDADAAAINATIQGIIPTVARGIFGEVGVLTNYDIENYKKTVPNLKSTEAQNKLISMVLMDVLSKSMETQLTNMAKSKIDVSNFAGEYTNIKDRIEKQKLNLGFTGLEDKSNEELIGGMTGSTSTTPYGLNLGGGNLLDNMATTFGWKK